MDDLRATLAALLDEPAETLADDANLFELGLDSLDLMTVVSAWRRDGVEVTFDRLAAAPTIAAWSALLAAAPATATVRTAAPEESGPFPLGLMQHAYWIGRADDQDLGGVAAHLYTEFDGAGVDPDRLRDAFLALAARHDMLRVRLTDNGAQIVGDEPGWRGLTVHDLRHLGAADVARSLDAIRDTMSHERLDIEGGVVFAAALSLLPGGATRLHLDVDMVAADAVSYRMLLAELARHYLDPGFAPPPTAYTYRDYRRDRPAAREGAARQAAAWWRERLPELPAAPRLPLRPAHETAGLAPAVARRHLTLSPDEYAALTAAARARGLTPAMVAAAAYAEVIGAWSTEPRFLLNVPLFDRLPLHPQVGDVVGDFSSSVMLAVDHTEPAPFTDRARRLQSRMHADAGYADHSGLEVLRDLTRRHGTPVLAPVVFTSAIGLGDLFGARVRRTFGDPVWIISQGPQVLLDAQVTELAGGVLVNWDSREERFADGVLDAMFDMFARLLRDLAADGPAWDLPVTLPPAHVALLVAAVAPAAAGDAPAVAPRTDLERVIALVWGDVLGADSPGVHDGFFALGGDSVLAATVVTRLREALDTARVTVRMLFAAPTIAGLAARLLAEADDPGRLAQVAEIYLEIESLSDDEVRAHLGEQS
ncbi:phosphopantetheine-binding protein [Catenuloplanes japonicus]|uniref:phosphopantetheine-binding protein n=1 Tax=Catenuloplanes japonicus TaxID=33876 RepID=UPI00068FFE10|nr:phosphopantetheine-binding protein [Catenuloplanes japonicus]